jgi:hypothetical protein
MLKFSKTPEEPSTAADRRVEPRLDKIFPVWIEGDRGGAMGVARNISDGGMFVETHEPQPLGTQVRITFPSQGGEMSAVAEVRYVCHLLGRDLEDSHAAQRGMGVRFLYFEAAADSRATIH